MYSHGRTAVKQHNNIKLMETCTGMSTERETQKNAAVMLSKQAFQGHEHVCVLMSATFCIHYFICGSVPQIQHHPPQINVCQSIFRDIVID